MSREIDKLIATEVMGWGVQEIMGGYSYYYTKDQHYNRKVIDTHLYKPSTDIKAAWEVVEKIRERGKVLIDIGYGSYEVVMKDFSKGPDDIKVVWSIKGSAPMAICLAALKLKGIKVPKDLTPTK